MRFRSIAFALSALLVSASPAKASLVTYQFDGFVDGEWARLSWMLGPSFLADITASAPFSMTVTWDTEAPILGTLAADTTVYSPAFHSLSATIGSYTFGLADTEAFGRMTVVNGSGSIEDRLSGIAYGDFDGTEWGSSGVGIMRWDVLFSPETWDSSVVPTLPAIPSSGRGVIYVGSGPLTDGKVGATINSIHRVPEPSALALFGAGLFATTTFARRLRRTQSRKYRPVKAAAGREDGHESKVVVTDVRVSQTGVRAIEASQPAS